MIRYADITLSDYLEKLSAREPVPGGGSAAALTAALGAALVCMVIRYSIGKGKPESIEADLQSSLQLTEKDRIELTDLVTLDSESYLAMREAKKKGPDEYRAATEAANQVSLRIKTLSEDLLARTVFLRKEGNHYLLSDVAAAEVFLKAAIATCWAMMESNS